jgi:uncharacterized protein YdaU (DUF1376 family)
MRPPAFQFYADDFIGGVSTMTQSEVGAYILLLCHQWQTGKISSEPERLKMVAKGEVSEHVLSKFPSGKNRRLEIERKKQHEYREKQRINGAMGGRPAKPKPNPSLSFGLTQTITQTEPKKSSPSPSPSPSTNGLRPIENTNGLRPIALFNGRLSAKQAEVADRFEKALGNQWDDGNGRKWKKRCKDDFELAERVVSQVEFQGKTNGFTAGPAQYAEMIWAEFSGLDLKTK